MPARSSAAERMRRFRERKRLGAVLLKFSASPETLPTLMQYDKLVPEDLEDEGALQFALGMCWDEYLELLALQRNGPP